VAELLCSVRAATTEQEAQFLIDVSTCLTYSLSYHDPGLSRTRLIDLLSRMILSAFMAEPLAGPCGDASVAAEPLASSGGQRYGRERASTRERILSTALRSFSAYGFNGIGVDGLAQSSGVSGGGIYRYFVGKEDILDTLLLRANYEVMTSVQRALSRASGPRDALEGLIDNYLSLAVAHPDLLAIYWTQSGAASDARKTMLSRERRAVVRDWVGVLRDLRPEVRADEADTMVYAALGILNSSWFLSGRWFLVESHPPWNRAEPLLRAMATEALVST
jgi:AcrR family transcriptional regulator